MSKRQKYMVITASLASLLLFGALAQAQGEAASSLAGTPRGAVADAAEKVSIEYLCGVNTTLMSCLEGDAAFDQGKCASLIRELAPGCKNELAATTPESRASPAYRQYVTAFGECILVNGLEKRGRSADQLDQCVTEKSGQQ